MNIAKLVFPAFSLLCSAALLPAADSLNPGRLDIDPPTLIGGGFQWWTEGDDNQNAGLEVSFREKGSENWLPAPAPVYREAQTYQRWQQVDGGERGGFSATGFGVHYTVGAHFAGSIIDLQEATAYEVRLVLNDPDGIEGQDGALEKIVEFKTRAVPQSAAEGRTVEVHPTGSDAGATLEQAIADLQPGDNLLLHAGTYTPPAFDEPATPVTEGDPVALPEPGRVLHVYPPDYKGEKQRPYFRNIIEAYVGANWDADFNFQAPQDPVLKDAEGQAFGVQPGDTILIHPGEYISEINHYHHVMGMWPTGALYMSRSGTADAPIVIKAAEGGEVIIDGDGAYRLFDLRSAEHHIIDGITVRNAYIGFDTGDGRNGMSGENVVIQNCKMENVHRGVIGDGVQVIDCEVSEGAFADRFEGTWTINTDGNAEKPITLKPAGDGPVVFDGKGTYLLFDTMNADHLIFENLIFQNLFMAIEAGGRFGQLGATGLTVKNCRFKDIVIGIFGLEGMCRDFTILDNVFSSAKNNGGDAPISGGYAVVLSGAGHAVGYNHTSGFWDHLNVLTSSTAIPGQRAWSMDFYNNYCEGAQDNVFEIDGTMWNVRFLRNLTGFAGGRQFSSQPTLAGPAYYLRNILYGGGMAKGLNSQGIFYYHNTIVGDPGFINMRDPQIAVNNVFLQEGVENGLTSGRRNRPIQVVQVSDVYSHNAWRLGGEPGPDNFGKGMISFEEFVEKASPGAVRVDFSDFENIAKPDWQADMPRAAPFPMDLRQLNFAPSDNSPVIDAALLIRGINDNFVGEGPDIGAIEKGREIPHYGPRTEPPTAN